MSAEYETFPEVEEIEDHASILDQIGKNDNCDIVSDLRPFKPTGKNCQLCGKESKNNFCCKEHESYYLKNKHMIDAIRNKATVYEYNEKLTHYRNLEYELDEDFNIILIKTSKWIRG